MSQLPDFTIATMDGWPGLFIKRNGKWYEYATEADAYVDDDDELFEEWGKAVVVALPTATPLTRNEAIASLFLSAPDHPGPDGDYGLKGVT